MGTLPDLAELSDLELKDLIHELEREENELSYRRRLLQGRIDIFRAELEAREGGAGLDVERLSAILSSRTTEPIERRLTDALSEEDRQELEALQQEEQDVSRERRLLHARIDILRAELVARLQRAVGGGTSLSHDDVERLSAMLAAKNAPPLEDGPA